MRKFWNLATIQYGIDIMKIEIEIEVIEKCIGIVAEKWEGRCYEIAMKIVDEKIVDGRAVYGHYRGQISNDVPGDVLESLS